MIVKNRIKTEVDKTTDETISDTTMMFLACATYVLHERNGFGKNRLMQFIADIEQVNRENSYEDLREYLNKTLSIELPELPN